MSEFDLNLKLIFDKIKPYSKSLKESLMRNRTVLLTLLLVGLTLLALPFGRVVKGPILIPSIKGPMMELVPLETFFSAPGETEDAFLMRVAVYLQTYTFHKQVEVCGNIWSDPQHTRFSVPLGTINAQLGCSTGNRGPFDDSGTAWQETGETIHSHPSRNRVVANHVDSLMGNFIEGNMVSNKPRKFSLPDLKGGPGYLVSGRMLQYQKDEGKVLRVVGTL